jgi:integrase
MTNTRFNGRMSSRKDLRALENFLRELGPSPCVERFLGGYGNVRTKTAYAGHLAMYLRWLKQKGVALTPDQLVQDNLRAVFESAPTDVLAKRKHTDLLGEYINSYLIERGLGDSTRNIAVAAIRGFYQANDSPLFGHWRVALQKPTAPPPPLHAEDIRKVLLAMPTRFRTPLVVAWQSGIEINRILQMDWSFALDREPPVKVELQGRKRHRKAYATFIGKESVEHLRLLRPMPMPDYTAMAKHLHMAARKAGTAGMLKNPDLRSWHPHALRHSFETEASHAGVKAEVRDFFLGHVSGIMWTYNHRDELHPEDLVREYEKIEPLVSLTPDEQTVRTEFQEREKTLQKRLEAAENLLAELRKELLASP